MARSDPILERKKAVSADARHGATTSEPHTQTPAADALPCNMIDVPPSDYLANAKLPASVSKV